MNKNNPRIVLGKAIAKAYDTGVNDASNLETIRCYRAMNREIEAQFNALVSDGWTFEPWEHSGQPYPETDSAPMLADMKRSKHLFYFKSEAGQEPHALMTLADNDRFRCVHDVLGHGAGDYQFSHAGETAAFQAHARKLSPNAIRALATETIGQNSALNFTSPNREYVVQKALLLPQDLIEQALVLRIDASDIDELGRGPYVR